MGLGGLCPPVTCGTRCVSASEGPSMWTWIAGATENRAALLHCCTEDLPSLYTAWLVSRKHRRQQTQPHLLS